MGGSGREGTPALVRVGHELKWEGVGGRVPLSWEREGGRVPLLWLGVGERIEGGLGGKVAMSWEVVQ